MSINVGYTKGRLTVLEILEPIRSKSGKLNPLVKCRCDCGIVKTYLLYNILYGKTRSCGCLQRELQSKKMTIHGKTNHPLFGVWSGMKDRCCNKKDPAYGRYGGRGIFICKIWRHNFISFYKWAIKNGWKQGLQIDRRNNNKGYSPQNCRIATPKMQARNKSSNVMIRYKGESRCVTEWAEVFGIPPAILFARLLRNVPTSRLFAPVKSFIHLTIGSETKTITQWATEYGLPKETVAERYRKGVRGEKLFFMGNMRSYEPSH